MSSIGPEIRRLARVARTALLAGSLSLLTLQQFGNGTRELLNAQLFRPGRPAAQMIGSGGGASKGPALSCDRLVPTCEAVLTERKRHLVLSHAGQPKPAAPATIGVFHNNCRPVVLRTHAIFCDFDRLRHILHPHLSLIAHASSVLC